MEQQRVVCAACRDQYGQIVLGARHFDAWMHVAIRDLEKLYHVGEKSTWTQGFLDNKNNFLDRAAAWSVASAAGQIIQRVGGDTANGGTLYTENLY